MPEADFMWCYHGLAAAWKPVSARAAEWMAQHCSSSVRDPDGWARGLPLPDDLLDFYDRRALWAEPLIDDKFIFIEASCDDC